MQPRRKSFLEATAVANEDGDLEANDNGIFSQTVHAFAEAFTAHGVHYIFERGQHLGSRLFWVLIVSIAFTCSCLMLERYYVTTPRASLLWDGGAVGQSGMPTVAANH